MARTVSIRTSLLTNLVLVVVLLAAAIIALVALQAQRTVDRFSRSLIDAGDIVAVISDGIFEAADPDGEQFGGDRVIATIRACRRGTAEEILAAVREAVDAFTRGHPPDDDRTMIIVKRVG